MGSTKAWGKIWRHGEAVRVCGPWGWDMATPLLILECLLQLLLSLLPTHTTPTHTLFASTHASCRSCVESRRPKGAWGALAKVGNVNRVD